MYKNHVRGRCVDFDAGEDRPGYAETDPSGRFGRFRDVLGKGATKTVYRAFDETLGMEVAWNQAKLHDIFRSPDELERLYSEVHLLKNLRHKSIIKFYASWIDVQKRTFNFITEMFTSGTLREYRLKYRRVNVQAVKNWARQILHGIVYLHGHDPPVIHRDLKCDNIFVNGHLAQVKIGDLGLAAILRDSHQAHSVIGTPEFMAPELYEEEYNELVDVYSFGMCMLEMLTCAYPYSECSNPAQIYKKVTSGKLPEAFYRIQDLQAREFIGKCLETVSKRPSARELLMDPFLATTETEISPIHKTPLLPTNPIAPQAKRRSTDMTITGTLNSEHDTIFLKVQISNTSGPPRNVYFPFDIVNDTAIDVATEMVQELAILEWEPFEIAKMIENEIESLVPNWKGDLAYDEEEQSSFNYHDGANESFYDAPSSSSSHASLPAFNSFDGNDVVPDRGWPLEAMFIHDDTSSQSSSNSHKYSNVNYSSDEEEEEDEHNPSLMRGDPHPPVTTPRNHNSTRFCPKGTYHNSSTSNDTTRKIASTRSLMDVRSQLLHKSLVEEISKRRMFKTVGCVESIGFQEPCGLTTGSKGSRGREKQRYK